MEDGWCIDGVYYSNDELKRYSWLKVLVPDKDQFDLFRKKMTMLRDALNLDTENMKCLRVPASE